VDAAGSRFTVTITTRVMQNLSTRSQNFPQCENAWKIQTAQSSTPRLSHHLCAPHLGRHVSWEPRLEHAFATLSIGA
jgi:hypothetical protein